VFQIVGCLSQPVRYKIPTQTTITHAAEQATHRHITMVVIDGKSSTSHFGRATAEGTELPALNDNVLVIELTVMPG
jgi:hypothetical protein